MAEAGAGPAAADSFHPRQLFWLLACIVGLHGCMAASRVAASLYLLHSGRPEWQVGLLLAAYAVAPIVLSLWAGKQADLHGFHWPMRLALALALFGAAVMLLSQHPLALAFGALCTGGALSTGAVGVQREAGLMAGAPQRLKQVFAWVALAPALSNAISPVVAGLLIDHAGWRAAFAYALALPLLAAWAASRVPRRPPRSRATPAPSGSLRSAWALLRRPALGRLILLNVVLAACWDAHALVVPVLGHGRGLSASQIGIVLGGFAVAAMLVRLGISAIGHRLQEQQVVRAAMLLALVAQAGYAWLPGFAGMVAGSALLGLALGSVQPMMLALVHQVTPPDRHGQALGVRMLATNAATVAMPVAFGGMAAALAPAAPMWAMALALGLSWQASRGWVLARAEG